MARQEGNETCTYEAWGIDGSQMAADVPLPEIVRWLNEVIVGWRNYFSFGNGTRQFQALDEYVRMRLLRFYRRKTGSRAKGVRGRFEDWLKNSGIEPFFQKGIFGQAR